MFKNWPAPEYAASNGKPWNVLLIQGDDFVADLITAQGMPTFVATYEPGFVVFPNSCCEVPVCFPGRASTLTGKRAAWSGVKNNNDGPTYELNAINHTVFRHLKARGYKTAFVGKAYNQLGKSGAGAWGTLPWIHPHVDFQRIQWGGIGYFDWTELGSDGAILVNHTTVDTNAVGTDYAVDVEKFRILEFLTATAVGQPWFIYWSTKGCHTGDGGSPIPPARHTSTSVTPIEDASFGLSRDDSGVPSWIEDEQDTPWNAAKLVDVRSTHTSALRVARALDENVDVILQAIAARGETANTIVIFKTDNTIASGEHQLTGKGTPHRSGLNAQIRVKVPGISGGSNPTPIQDLDVTPFICAMTGAVPSYQLDGTSFLKAMQDLTYEVREAALCVSYGNSSPFSSLRFNDRTYYEMEAHDELPMRQPGGWAYSGGEVYNSVNAADATALAILKPRLGTIV